MAWTASSSVMRISSVWKRRSEIASVGVPMKIVGHRGASFTAPENTVPAIHMAWREGADGVEIDVRVTRDGRVVLMHDDDIRRTTSGQGRVAELSWDAIRLLDAGSWKDPKWRAATIPQLRDVLSIVPSSRRLFIEVKCGKEIVPALQRDFEIQHPSPKSVAFLSFDAVTLRELRNAFPAFPCYLNIESPGNRGAPSVWTAEVLADMATRHGFGGLSLGWAPQIKASFAADIQARGLDLAVWCVDDDRTASEMLAAGVPWLMTNRVAQIRQFMARKK